MDERSLLRNTDRGLYCEAGGFYVDPWRPVDRALITHAHSDHARWGMGSYLCAEPGRGVLRRRVGDAPIQSLPYGTPLRIGEVDVSFHPAGHILGSAQIRIERGGEVWVVSGDYKTGADRTCAPFEPVPCHTFITESTFGLPIYRWPAEEDVTDAINAWWADCAAAGKTALLLGYALGKCQRALAGLDPGIGPILLHGAVVGLTRDYEAEGIVFPPYEPAGTADKKRQEAGSLVLAPPSAAGTAWTRRFGDVSTAFLSGWMAVRGARRRRAVDRGFVMSDHVDWPSLLAAIGETGAERVYVTHGYVDSVVRYLRDQGLDAHPLRTAWEGEQDDSAGEESPE